MKHNKKRNTAFLFDALINELTKATINKDDRKKGQIVKVVKEHFKKGTILAKENELYKTLLETDNLDLNTSEKLLFEVKRVRFRLNDEDIFDAQTALINDVNKTLTKETYNAFVPNYRSLASIAQIFNEELPVKSRVLLEQKLIDRMCGTTPAKEEQVKHVDNIVFKKFAEKFNDEYSQVLSEQQKELINQYIFSFADNGLGLKTYLNEEIGRLKKLIEESMSMTEISSDKEMLDKTKEVASILESYKTRPIDESMIRELVKIQNLTQELQG
tara:strand:+ start:5127 stop:5942 length:816 start_codon:yes stop_codon:yes gene_type:complete